MEKAEIADIQKQPSARRLPGNHENGVQTSLSESATSEFQNERPVSPGTLALMCDENDIVFTKVDIPSSISGSNTRTNMNLHGSDHVYSEQERLVLTRFRGFLNKLITRGSIKGDDMSSIFPTSL